MPFPPLISLTFSDASRVLLSSLSPSEKLNPATLNRHHKGDDIIWGKLIPSRQTQTPFSNATITPDYDSDGDDYGGGLGAAYDGNEDDYDDFSPPAPTTSAPTPLSTSSGLEIELSGGLLQAQRKVEKISIGFVPRLHFPPSLSLQDTKPLRRE